MKTMIIILLVFAMCFTAACSGAKDGVSSAASPENSVENTSDSTETSDTESTPETSAPESSAAEEESVEIGQTDPDYGYGTLPTRVNVELIDENTEMISVYFGGCVAEHFTFYDALASYYLTYREIFDLDAENGFAAKMAKYNDSYFEKQSLVLLLCRVYADAELTVKSILENEEGGIDIELCTYTNGYSYKGDVYSYVFVEIPEGMGTEENTEINLTLRRDDHENYNPTLRPAVTADKWAELNPPEEYPVEYQCWRGADLHDGEQNGFPYVRLIRSVDELEEYRDAEKYSYSMLHAIDRYDDEYFKEQVLIMLCIENGSGTPKFKPLSASPDDKGGITLEVCEYVAEVCTDDMAYWTMLIEPMKGLKVDSTDKITVNFSTDYMENYVPESSYHGYAKEEQVKDGVGIEYTEDVEVTVSYIYASSLKLIKGAEAAEIATLLANLDYKAEETCRCLATVQIRFDGRVYHLALGERFFARCDDGQVSLTEAQVKRIVAIIANKATHTEG